MNNNIIIGTVILAIMFLAIILNCRKAIKIIKLFIGGEDENHGRKIK